MDSSALGQAAETTAAAPDSSVDSPRFPIVQMGWFFALLVILFLPVLIPMVHEWATYDDMGHGFFVPVVAGYIIWNDRERILSTPVKPCPMASLLLVWAFCQMVLGFLGADFFLARTAFMLAL